MARFYEVTKNGERKEITGFKFNRRKPSGCGSGIAYKHDNEYWKWYLIDRKFCRYEMWFYDFQKKEEVHITAKDFGNKPVLVSDFMKGLNGKWDGTWFWLIPESEELKQICHIPEKVYGKPKYI